MHRCALDGSVEKVEDVEQRQKFALAGNRACTFLEILSEV